MNTRLYPLQFEPILKEKIWGGDKLHKQFGKSCTSENTGESWEISAVKDDVSRISNGIYAGKLLTDLIETYPNELLGTEVYKHFGTQFPLLFKFIDAKEDLSIQVHPDDVLAKKRHNSLGKTEMWYVMQADQDAALIIGFKENSTADEYVAKLESGKLLSLLNEFPVNSGDVFFLEPGTVHSIGAGLVLAEIQQTSDITYRLYDFDRKDKDGKKRDLHVDLALEAINFDQVEAQKFYFKEPNQSNRIVECPYFTTNFIPLTERITVKKSGESFTVYMCVDGCFELEIEREITSFKKGDTVLIPAALRTYTLHGNATILEIYI